MSRDPNRGPLLNRSLKIQTTLYLSPSEPFNPGHLLNRSLWWFGPVHTSEEMGPIDLEGIGKKREQNFCCSQTIWDLVETFGRTAKVSSPTSSLELLRVFEVFHIASKAWVKSHSSNHSKGLYVVSEELRSNTMIQACLAELDLNSQIKLSVARSCLLATGCCYNNVKVKITVKCSFCLCACKCCQTCLTKCNQCSE